MRLQERMKQTLSKSEETVKERGIAFTVLLEEGSPKENICVQAERLGIDIVFIGQVGAAAKSASLGSTSDYVLRNCRADVCMAK